MARDGSGGYSLTASSWNPATNGNSATAADYNAQLADIVAAIQGSLAADGQTPLTGNLQFGNNKGTGLAAATTLGDGLRLENLVAGSDLASATSVTIPLEGSLFKITGTTTIAGFASTRVGRNVWIRFDGALTLTNSATFLMPQGLDVTTVAGDVAQFLYDSVGWRCVAYRRNVDAPAFCVYISANQTITSGPYTKINFDTEEFDTNSNFDAVTNHRFTPTVAGYYQINASAYLSGTGVNGAVAIYQNGIPIALGNSTPTGGGGTNIISSASTLVRCNGTTDYIEAYAYSSSTVIYGGNISYTYMNGFLARSA